MNNATGTISTQTILAVNLGTTTGFALKLPDGRIVSGVWKLKGGRFEGGGMRYVRFEDNLKEIHRLTPLDRVYFEEVRAHLGVDAAHAYGAFVGALTTFCEREKIAYAGVPVSAIKITATGKGNAKKEAMLATAKKRWPNQSVEDDNQADALWLLETATQNQEHSRRRRTP